MNIISEVPPQDQFAEIRVGLYSVNMDGKLVQSVVDHIDLTVCKEPDDLKDFDLALICSDRLFAAPLIGSLRQISDVPAIVLSQNVDPATLREVLMAGADDLMRAPFHCDELRARIRAVIRRCRRKRFTTITTGNISLTIEAKTVTVDGVAVRLSAHEYAILEMLSLRKSTRLPKMALFEYIYQQKAGAPDPKIIDVFVCKLRKKLQRVGANPRHIETIWGFGYKLVDEPTQTHQKSDGALHDQVTGALNGVPKTTRELAAELGRNYHSINPILLRLCEEGVAQRTAEIPYAYTLT